MQISHNNYLFGLLAGLLLTIMLLGPVAINSYLISQKIQSHRRDYVIVDEFDYANGQYTRCKQLKNGTVAWRKYRRDGFADLYAKYNIGHGKPLLTPDNDISYIRNPFICFLANFNGDDWWCFWKWEWHFFEDVPSGARKDNYLSSVRFLFYVSLNDLPTEEVQRAYHESVKLFDDKEKLDQFIDDFIDSHERQSAIDLVAFAAKTGKLPPEHIEWMDKASCILKHRDDFPDNLPGVIMDKMADITFNDTFYMLNYQLHPTEYNALYLICRETDEQVIKEMGGLHYLSLESMFNTLLARGLLEKFILQIYPPDMQTPPLPPPALAEYDVEHANHPVYFADTFKDLPEREKLLRITCFPDLFRPHWQKRLKTLLKKESAPAQP